ncbi:MAG TPA: hypothetical protein VMI34_07560 [Candidatus Bathyarchaeia archaeon]|nr:hypothetical protein [Candidatus Bathyarchaeia archaeon]
MIEPPDTEVLALTVRLGAMTVKAWALDVPPPGPAVSTVTVAGPAAARSLAAMLAVSWVAPTNVVGRPLPFHCTTELGMKFDPFTVRLRAGPFCGAVVGAIDVNVGTGFGITMLKVAAAAVPPPGAGVTTVTAAVLAPARSLAGMLAVSWVALTKLVVRMLPFHCTVEAGTNPVPVTVSVKAGPPCVALLGASEEMAGTGLTEAMVNGAVTLADTLPTIVHGAAPLHPPPDHPPNVDPDAGVAVNVTALLDG